MSERTAEELIDALDWRAIGGDRIDGDAADWIREHEQRDKRITRTEDVARHLYCAVMTLERGDELPEWLRNEVERAKSFVEHQLIERAAGGR